MLLLATCAAFPDGDEDAGVLMPALAARGVDARWVVWDDPSVDWSAGPVVLRSTWDYTLRRADFLGWVRQLPVVHNRADVVEWNSDKVYLRELAASDVPVTPTTVVAPGTDTALPANAEFVVKPSVGAGSRGVGRFAAGEHEAATDHLATLHDAGRTALVQPYLRDVDEQGETALVYLAGRYSHAIRKGAMLDQATSHALVDPTGLFIEENIARREAAPEQIAVGDAALAFLTGRFDLVPLYARVDLLPTPSGPVVVELELTEPSLFLTQAPGSAQTFADALARL